MKYDEKRIQAIAMGIHSRMNGKWFDHEDISQDITLCLLEGKRLASAFKYVRDKYKVSMYTVCLDDVSEKHLVDTTYKPINEKRMTPLDKKKLEKEFYERLDTLGEEDQTLIMLKSLGMKDKDIAKKMDISHSNARVRIHRAIKEMRHG